MSVMPKADVVEKARFDREMAPAPVRVDFAMRGIAVNAAAWIRGLTDARLAWVIGAVLFVLSAWPLLLTETPPFQDLPNHLASVTVIQHPERYPEFVSNGFLKTNAALFTWLFFVGKVVGVKLAAKSFTALVLAANAFVFPAFFLTFLDRRRMVWASLLAWPTVHNWFVSMGMLDFALAVPLALLLITLFQRMRAAPSWRLGFGIALVAACTWYAHVFALMVVHLLLGIELIVVLVRAGKRAFLRDLRHLVLPVLPTTALTLVSLYHHLVEPQGAMTGYVSFRRLLPPWELAYNLWAEWQWQFTWLSIATIVPTAILTVLAFWRWRDQVAFFSPVALLALFALYILVPYTLTNWFHVNSRFIPFLWAAAILRVPRTWPKWASERALAFGMVGLAMVSSVGLGVDYVRLDDDVKKFTAGVAAVPEGARLLPLLFRFQLTAENTRSLQHAWGHYVVERQTAAPLLFAHSRSFPVTYRTPPSTRFHHNVLEGFAVTMRSPEWLCGSLRTRGVQPDDCTAVWRQHWAEFWRDAEPRFDHVLLWEAPPEVLALVPRDYKPVFVSDKLHIFGRQPHAK